ncbi:MULTISPECIES: hypothetical protein [unclassified Imperialibacter]|uniref:hypothetical protein n=1 Tax=unclassified Imperialibacter TaxID=2629706 RepID=UPI00125F2EF7|nr:MULTISPECIES: hypothetical protein [unclassified Imperialibacter]
MSGITSGQSSEFFKVWISSAMYTVDKTPVLDLNNIRENSEEDTQVTEGEIDTSYFPLQDIIELNTDGTATYKILGKSEQRLTWSKISDREILIDFEGKVVARLDSTNYLSLVLTEQDTISTKFLFRPLRTPRQTISESDLATLLIDNSWKLVNPADTNDSSELAFEPDSMTASVRQKGSDIYLASAKWMIDSYADHRFIFVSGGFYPDYFHLLNISQGDQIDVWVDRYASNGYMFDTGPPKRQEYHLIAAPGLSKFQYDSISTLLQGTWTSPILQFNIDDDYLEPQVRDTHLSYTFRNNGTVTSSMIATAIHQPTSAQITRTEEQSWRLSKSGKLLILDDGKSQNMIVAISFLNPDTIQVTKDMKSFEGYNAGQMTFRLSRQK